DKLGLQKVVLIGHSMSGTNSVEAYSLMPDQVVAIVPLDTRLDLDKLPTREDMDYLFGSPKPDFVGTLEMFKSFIFAKTSPQEVMDRIMAEMKAADPKLAIAALETVYAHDISKAASQVKVPVRAINSDLNLTHVNNNQKYFKDYD